MPFNIFLLQMLLESFEHEQDILACQKKCPNVWNAHGILSECLECTTIFQECATDVRWMAFELILTLVWIGFISNLTGWSVGICLVYRKAGWSSKESSKEDRRQLLSSSSQEQNKSISNTGSVCCLSVRLCLCFCVLLSASLRSQKANQATPSLSHSPVKAPVPVRTHCTNAWWNRCKTDLNRFPRRKLDETTGTFSYYMDENHSVGSEIQRPQYGRRSWPGSEPSTLETDVYVWLYALLVVLARNDDDDEFAAVLQTALHVLTLHLSVYPFILSRFLAWKWKDIESPDWRERSWGQD